MIEEAGKAASAMASLINLKQRPVALWGEEFRGRGKGLSLNIFSLELTQACAAVAAALADAGNPTLHRGRGSAEKFGGRARREAWAR